MSRDAFLKWLLWPLVLQTCNAVAGSCAESLRSWLSAQNSISIVPWPLKHVCSETQLVLAELGLIEFCLICSSLWVWLKFPALFSTHLFLLPAKSLLSWLSLISPVGFPPGVSSVQKPLQVEMWPLEQVITTALGNQHRQPALLGCTNECCSNLNVWKNYLGISLGGQIWFQKSGVAPRVLHFLQVPRKCQFYCFMDHILNITSWPQPSVSQALHLFPEFTAD